MPQSKRTLKGVLGGLAGLVGLSTVAGVLVTASVTPVFTVAGAAAAQSIDLFENLPSNLEVDRPMEATTIYATDRDGSQRQLARFYDQNRIPLNFDQVAPVMYDALLSSEDKNFYSHGGIDLVGTTKALVDNLRGSSTRGASSISQQYVKNVQLQECERGVKLNLPQEERDQQLADCWNAAANSDGSEGIQRKLQEMRYAMQIEKTYSKNDILIGYLNLVSFGGTTYGIEAAAQRYFSTSAANLTLNQAATLAGMVQNPNEYRIDQPDNEVNGAADGYSETLTRRNYVLGRLLDDGKITQEQYDAAHAEPITPVISTPSQGCGDAGGYAYFCQYVRATLENDPAFGETWEERQEKLLKGGLDVYTTLNFDVQDRQLAAMDEYTEPTVEGMTAFGAAGVTVQPDSGRILSIVQNTNFTESNPAPGFTSLVYAGDINHGGSTGFSVGSTYKVFTLIDWLEKGHSLRETLNATNRDFKLSCNGDQLILPRDVGNAGGNRGYTGSILQFTAASLNTGFAAMAERLDVCEINAVAERMGVKFGNGRSVTDTSYDLGAFDVLGSKAIAPVDMASVYGTIANKGVYCPPHAIDKVVGPGGEELQLPDSTCREVLKPEIAAATAYALQGVMEGGTGSNGNPYDGTPLIGKTGTHNNAQTMLVESSTKAATAIWVGQADGDGQNLNEFYVNGNNVPDIRFPLGRDFQAAANIVTAGGDPFPDPPSSSLKPVYVDLPNVVGMSQEDAARRLENAGFDYTIGAPVNSNLAPGVIAAQDPGAGQVTGGTVVTISPSNGQGTAVPDVSGQIPNKAVEALQQAGLVGIMGDCTAGGGSAKVTTTDPPAGTSVAKGATVRLNYSKQNCP
ncbi:transglycosylase domain-containing protein [Microbacterium resistens]|uniref:transglycosylase domain-containing protein n=1 Tax=Microbacterium resistens TaxID=156977 RepID=UPI0009FF5AAA|nr:transglycosylase domain-containing protein [Microbacterium resistens]